MTKFKGWCGTRIVKEIDVFADKLFLLHKEHISGQHSTLKILKIILPKLSNFPESTFEKWVKLHGDILHRFFWLVYGPLLQFSFKQLYKLGILCYCLIDYSITLISKERATVVDPGEAPLIFRPNWRPKDGKNFFLRPCPPLIYGCGWPCSLLISRSGSGAEQNIIL